MGNRTSAKYKTVKINTDDFPEKPPLTQEEKLKERMFNCPDVRYKNFLFGYLKQIEKTLRNHPEWKIKTIGFSEERKIWELNELKKDNKDQNPFMEQSNHSGALEMPIYVYEIKDEIKPKSLFSVNKDKVIKLLIYSD